MLLGSYFSNVTYVEGVGIILKVLYKWMQSSATILCNLACVLCVPSHSQLQFSL